MIYLIGKWFEILIISLRMDLSKSKKIYKTKTPECGPMKYLMRAV